MIKAHPEGKMAARLQHAYETYQLERGNYSYQGQATKDDILKAATCMTREQFLSMKNVGEKLAVYVEKTVLIPAGRWWAEEEKAEQPRLL